MDHSGRIQRALSDQRGRIGRAEATYGRERRLAGSLHIDGIGRTGIDIVFPVIFVNEPVIVFGQQLGDNDRIDHGAPPTVEAMVSRWATRQAGNVDQLLWTGCRIVATTRGHPTQRQTLTWLATGVAIGGQPNMLGTTGDSI